MSSLHNVLIEPLYFLFKRSPFLSYLKELEESQYYSETVLLEKQWGRLKEILSFSYYKNLYYRKKFDTIGLSPNDIKSLEDIPKIPFLTKNEIRDNAEHMISDGYQLENLMKFKTGGSTGKALELYITEECSEQRNACARRHDRWTGWEPGEPIGAVWGNPVLPVSLKSKLMSRFLNPMIYLDTMNITDDAVNQFARDWNRMKPTLLYGHAHSLYILAEYVKRLGIETINTQGILSTSMMLMPHERRTIEDVFGIKVTDRYGCEEVSLIASECEKHEGMHLNIEHLYIEFIKGNGSPANPGEMGQIIVTDLMNKAMPFIRYQVEDMGVPSDKKCSCGRGLPLMKSVVGRTADFLIRRDRSRVAGVSLIENTLTKIPGIDQMQIVQETLDHLVIKIVRGREYKLDSQDKLTLYFHCIFGDDVCIEVLPVEDIQPEYSGKYRFSVCKIESH